MAKKKPVGRPSKYKADYVRQVRKLAELGATDIQMAEFFGISEKTFYTWREKHPEFLQAIKDGKQAPDDAVERSLFERATGYSHPEEKIFCHQGRIVRTETVKHYPPDTAAAFIWVKNRRPEQWRDRHEIGIGKDDPLALIAAQWAKSMEDDPD